MPKDDHANIIADEVVIAYATAAVDASGDMCIIPKMPKCGESKCSSVINTSRSRRHGLEICPATLDEMSEDVCPILSAVPCYFTWRVDFDGHDLADGAALDEDDACADTAGLSAALFASLDISDNEGIADVCARNDMSSRY